MEVIMKSTKNALTFGALLTLAIALQPTQAKPFFSFSTPTNWLGNITDVATRLGNRISDLTTPGTINSYVSTLEASQSALQKSAYYNQYYLESAQNGGATPLHGWWKYTTSWIPGYKGSDLMELPSRQGEITKAYEIIADGIKSQVNIAKQSIKPIQTLEKSSREIFNFIKTNKDTLTTIEAKGGPTTVEQVKIMKEYILKHEKTWAEFAEKMKDVYKIRGRSELMKWLKGDDGSDLEIQKILYEKFKHNNILENPEMIKQLAEKIPHPVMYRVVYPLIEYYQALPNNLYMRDIAALTMAYITTRYVVFPSLKWCWNKSKITCIATALSLGGLYWLTGQFPWL